MVRIGSKNRILTSLLALAIFASGLMMAFHHHAVEAKAADHCSVCVIGQQARTCDGAAAPDLGISRELMESSLFSPQSPLFQLSSVLLGKRSQAPPLA